MIEQVVVPLVMVTDPPTLLQPPEVVMPTARLELLLAATVKFVLYTALAGGAVVTLIVWLAF
jgi:hypothetical protein